MTPVTLAEAENDIKAAYLDGVPAKIAAAEALVDRLDIHPAPIPLLSAALWYAEQGLKVFPLIPGRKIPWAACLPCKETCTGPEICGHPSCHGLKDATSDPDIIRERWAEKPQANVGIATGHLVDVVDIDGAPGQVSRTKHWDEIFGQIDADSVAKVLTPRHGGMHIYVPATGEGNDQEIVPAVDYRGEGGYVVAPPSVILPGSKDTPGTYRFLGAPSFAALTSTRVA